ncbi:MAG TPA: alpha/beta hydrolase, partial [Maritimibacter sp.]|nr:alpha/beta hydrolase [Maritimibacter sp.]
AMQALDLGTLDSRTDADAALACSIDTKSVRAFLLQSLDLRAKRWKLNLDVLARDMDLITGFPEVTGHYDGPTLFLSGGDSDYVQPHHRARIKALFPEAKQAKIPGTGHWLHAEKPRDFEASVRAFFGIT